VAVQRIWRYALKRNAIAFEQLTNLWNSTISALISSVSKKKQTVPRSKRVKENNAVRYLNIPIALRNHTLSAHFSQSKRRLAEDCHTFVQVRSAGQGSAVFPKLKSMPTEEEMVKMVERAVESVGQAGE